MSVTIKEFFRLLVYRCSMNTATQNGNTKPFSIRRPQKLFFTLSF